MEAGCDTHEGQWLRGQEAPPPHWCFLCAAEGLQAIVSSFWWGGSCTRGTCRAALLPGFSMEGLQAKQMLHPPTAQLHSLGNEPSHKDGSLALQGAEQPHSQHTLIQAREAQFGDEKVKHCKGCHVVSPKELPQLLVQPGQQEPEHSWLLAEHGRPGGHHPCSVLGCSSGPCHTLSDHKLCCPHTASARWTSPCICRGGPPLDAAKTELVWGSNGPAQ